MINFPWSEMIYLRSFPFSVLWDDLGSGFMVSAKHVKMKLVRRRQRTWYGCGDWHAPKSGEGETPNRQTPLNSDDRYLPMASIPLGLAGVPGIHAVRLLSPSVL
jgi:hypothetical protein